MRVDTNTSISSLKLPADLRRCVPRKHYYLGTKQTLLEWAKRDLLFQGIRHPYKIIEVQSAAFLNNLAALTQNPVNDSHPLN